jgi:hypothetical protein
MLCMRKIICTVWIGLGLASHSFLFGQVIISGPACVIPGLTYQYRINAVWDSASTMQVCATGGTITGASGACTASGTPPPFVQVMWKAGVVTGSLLFHSSQGDTTIQVSIAPPLQAGEIDTAVQSIGYSGAAAIIHCSAVAGGSCNPVYSYQWQQSTDAVYWTDIPGDTTQHLLLPGILTNTTFFRRKTTEATSGRIVYSRPATVFVGPPPAPVIAVDSTVSSTGTAFANPLKSY